MIIKNIKQINIQDWDELVEKTYNKIYSFQQQDGCKGRGVENISVPEEYVSDYKNDTIPEIINGGKKGVSFKSWLERDTNAPLNPSKEDLKTCHYYWGKTEKDEVDWKQDKSHISMFWKRNFYPHVSMIANDLYSKGLLEAGEYQINIDW